jgi:uncharacterized protein involved in tolerance to divalent cations
MYSDFGIEKIKKLKVAVKPKYMTQKNEGYYWNEHIKPEADAYQIFKYDNSKAEELLKAGFGVVNTHIPDGIAQGTGALVALNNEDQGIVY